MWNHLFRCIVEKNDLMYSNSPELLLPKRREDEHHLGAVRGIRRTAEGVADGILTHLVEHLSGRSLRRSRRIFLLYSFTHTSL